jgi:dihydroorotate dehydrogenase
MLSTPARTRPIELFGLKFPTAVGLAAGMDKNAQFWRAAARLRLRHVEIGTVPRRSSPATPGTLFRFPKQEAIINRMGFNNEGAEAIATALRKSGALESRRIPLAST